MVPSPPPFCVPADVSISADTKSRVTDSSQSPGFRIRTESGQVSPYSPEQSSLHESEGLFLPSLHLLYSASVPKKVVMSNMFRFRRRRLCVFFSAIILFDPFFSQGLRGILTAQLR